MRVKESVIGRNYDIIDMVKFVFAILIFSLHLPKYGGGGEAMQIIAQFLGRLGVPFFFMASGFFLAKKLENDCSGVSVILRSYLFRIGKLFLIWLFIYLPIIILYRSYTDYENFPLWKEILFMCPAYLWYLVATFIGCIPVIIFFKHYPNLLFLSAIVLYFIGVTGNTYLYMDGFDVFWSDYLKEFLTTRNGVFFGFPFILFGAIAYKLRNAKLNKICIIAGALISYIIFAVEVFGAKDFYNMGKDCSMYFTMPIISYFIFLLSLSGNKKISGAKIYRMLSSWIYLSQFLVIMLTKIICYHYGFRNSIGLWIICSILSVGLFFLVRKISNKVILHIV